MEVVRGVDELREAILELRRAGHAIGFVPTTGLVHSGQLSLVQRARQTDGGVVVSNQADPTGAATEEERLLALLEREGVDVAFLPSHGTVDPPHVTRITVDGLTGRLEGASRPGYLDEVATTTMKLLHLVGPAHLYLGQKDAQRVVVVRRMLRRPVRERGAGGLPRHARPGRARGVGRQPRPVDRGAPRRDLPVSPPSRRRRRPTTPGSDRPRSFGPG